MSYSLLWLGPAASEVTTLLFFVLTGSAFRPSLANPYLSVKQEDDGEEQEPVSLSVRSSTGGSAHGSGAGIEHLTSHGHVRSEEENAFDSEYGLGKKPATASKMQKDIEMGGRINK